jgi:DNA-binding transcriptional ArsR family regulator
MRIRRARVAGQSEPAPATTVDTVFRIHFTAEDLTRTRFTTTYGPLAETLFGLALATGRARGVVNDWQRRTLIEAGLWRGPLPDIAGLCGSVDLFTVVGVAPSLDEGLEALMAAGRDAVKAEVSSGLDMLAARLRMVGRSRPGLPPWWHIGRDLADDRAVRRTLVDGLRLCAEATVATRWDTIRGHLAQEVARRSQQLVTEGLGQVLSTLHPGLRWRSPVLEMDWPVAGDVHLTGRGLELVPSVFYRELTPPYAPAGDRSAPWVLFYPVPVDAGQAFRMLRSPGTETSDQALADLLGRSRALVLRSLADGGSTTELARRTGLSLAGASQHAAVLRKAKLIATSRDGNAVRHCLTALGHQLLEQH